MTAQEPARLLVVESDPGVRRMMARRLVREGYEVIELEDSTEMVAKIEATRPDLVIAEVGGPVSFDPLLKLREHSDIPTIAVLWSDLSHDEAAALDLGADDCVTRPLSFRLLAARVRAVLRRARPTPATHIRSGELDIDLASRAVLVGDARIDLPPREFDLLAFLASHPGETIGRDRLLVEVWRSSAGWQQASTVTEHVHRLRLRLEPDPARPRWLQTVRGVGYRFIPAMESGVDEAVAAVPPGRYKP